MARPRPLRFSTNLNKRLTNASNRKMRFKEKCCQPGYCYNDVFSLFNGNVFMIDPRLLSYGVAAVFTLTILKLVFEFVREIIKKSPDPNILPIIKTKCSDEMREDIAHIIEVSDKLWTIHAQYTENGAPKWFFPVSVRQDISKILDIVKRLEQKGKGP